MPPLRASHTRADGTPVVRIEIPFEVDHDEAARALAIVYAAEPLRKRVHALRDGLARAASDAVLTSGEQAPERAVAAYRERLRELRVFPDPADREAMLHRLHRAQAKHRATPRDARPTAPRVKQPAIWAKHERKADGRPVVRIEVPRYYALDQAARALAAVYAERAEPLRSSNALRLGLQEAGRRRVGSRSEGDVATDSSLVEKYRRILLDESVFAE